jgi:hypothetical protein
MESPGLAKVVGVDAKLTIDPGLDIVSASTDVFLLARRGFLAGVLMLPSCHFNLTP